jgi:5-(carboxyamino)imidazole ribonucleotide synthase
MPTPTPTSAMHPGTPALVAVLGGGQLGRMLGLAATPLGIRCRFLDPSADATAAAVGELVVGDLGDADAISRTAAGATVVTYEWEGVPAPAARAAASSAPVRPDPRALEVAQDRIAEKEMFSRLGVLVARFAAVDGPDDVERATETTGFPTLLKTRRGGYDGKGQQLVDDRESARAAWHDLGRVPLIAEAVVGFERELSIIAARGLDGDTACYPLVENSHAAGILRTSRAPAPRVTAALQRAAEDIARRVLDDLDYVGVLTVELFEHDGALLANELAPRVHNSGHWTIEGAVTSQFEQHVRAVLGLPLGAVDTTGKSAMVNCIGRLPDPAAVLAIPGAHLHDYAKAPRPARKVGHVTVVADDDAALEERLAKVRALQRDDG